MNYRCNSDRLSILADDLLLEIIDRLPLRDRVKTSVLSRRWRWLWRDMRNIKVGVDLFTNVYNILPKLTSPYMEKVGLDLGYWGNNNNYLTLFRDRERNSLCIYSWLDWVLQLKVIEELSLYIKTNSTSSQNSKLVELFPHIPFGIFEPSSVVADSVKVLDLRPWVLGNQEDCSKFIHNQTIHLPNLKRVSLRLHPFIPGVLEKLVSCSPSLEHLSFEAIVVETPTPLSLSSRSLKRLDMVLHQPFAIVLNTPRLQYLNFEVVRLVYASFSISFVEYPSPPLLLACSIWSLYNSLRSIFLPCNLFKVISSAVSLTINDNQPTPLTAPLPFTRLTHLTLRLCAPIQPESPDPFFSGLALLQHCPVLEVLTLDLSNLGRDPFSLPDSHPHCLLTCVKTIHITALPIICDISVMPTFLHLLNYLLGGAQALELLTINIDYPLEYRIIKPMHDELSLIKKASQVPRSSPLCTIQFNGVCHKICINKASFLGPRFEF